MLFTATTLKDSPANVAFFVAANLASGVDHMFLFLDAPHESGQQEVVELLTAEPRVTCLPTTRQHWWQGDRPSSLNVRQRINANWARSVLEPFSWAEWLFHIDGDEVARLDREALACVPAEYDAVWLPPLEAVSELQPARRPTLFKRPLDDAELNLLHVLGLVDDPTNQAYFHGHVLGKSGIRPGSALALTLHEAVSADGQRQDRHSDDRLRLLHYDAVSGEEFIRKWTALAKAGPTRYRASRVPVARALKTLASLELSDEVRERYLLRVYEASTQDDVTVLDDLGFLVPVDPESDPWPTRDMPVGAAAALAQRVTDLRGGDKRRFFVADAQSDRQRDASGRRHGGPKPREYASALRALVRRH